MKPARIIFLCVVLFVFGGMSQIYSMEIAESTVRDFKTILSGNNDYDEGSIIFINEPNKTAEVLDYINEMRMVSNLEPLESQNGRLVVLTGGAARQFFYQFSRVVGFPKSIFGRVFPNKYLVFTDRLAEIIMNVINKSVEISSNILNAEIGFILGALKRTLTYEIVNAIVNQKIAWYAIALVPFAWVLDHVKVLLATAGVILTAAVSGVVLAIEYTAFAIVKILELVGTTIVKVVKWVIDKLKKPHQNEKDDVINDLEPIGHYPLEPRWNLTEVKMLIKTELRYLN